jgi:hypothetical protein
MKSQEKTEEFKQFFLLAFTRELIKNYFIEDIDKIEFEEETQKQIAKKRAREVVREFKRPLKMSPVRQLKAMTDETFKPLPMPFRPKRRLIIPRPNLPPRLQYIKPVPTSKQLDLGKLNPLIQDPAVQSIECNGPNENIIVKTPSERKTGIILNKEEIDDIINTFSQSAKIPVSEGVFRAAVGSLFLSGIISEVIGSKFIIKRIRYPTPPPQFLR